jgi:hypothetical protein
VRHGDGRLASGETGVARTFFYDISERATDQRFSIDRSDTDPDDGQEILSKIRV